MVSSIKKDSLKFGLSGAELRIAFNWKFMNYSRFYIQKLSEENQIFALVFASGKFWSVYIYIFLFISFFWEELQTNVDKKR